ncbi:MAG: DUF1552 domain-containing protein [Candidatus Binatia bacterium]|nr:DUF1552 domain-containing protein [Candidatus Binatia bacterium]MDG1958364.1 DUF1552 domain-containing protein [Candidatus Binatia bacterium]MDG2009291.1 DUF1552 domain-containing protein [Candidatus Binatia bacterium]HAC79343.1 hypothetical protein [Deltaproteobacteria bacterium]
MNWNRRIQRRTVLRAGGVALALPLLEAMRPVLGRAQAEPVRRMLNICGTLGFYAPSWRPETTGDAYEPSEYLQLLDRHRSRYTVISGLSHEDQQGRQPHNSEITFLSGARRPGMDGFTNTISMDQVTANHLGYVTRFPSLSLGSLKAQSQSYLSSGVMVPAETSPSSLFRSLFLQGSPQEVAQEMGRLREGKSILDHLRRQRAALLADLGGEDRHRLHSYFESVRGAERELSEMQAWVNRPKPVVGSEQPTDIAGAGDLIGRIRLFFNLIPLIFATDSSRVISLMMQDHSTVLEVPGTTNDQHSLSHHGQEEGKIDQLRLVEKAILVAFGELLDSLHAGVDGGSSLLDSTSILLGSNLGNANAHIAYDLPIMVAGGGFDHGSHVDVGGGGNQPLSNLFLTLLQSMGVDTESFGQSTGALRWG